MSIIKLHIYRHNYTNLLIVFLMSRVTESYITVTGQYITQELEFKTVLLGCCHFSGSHSAQNIASELENILNRWNLRQKVNFAVSDNAANMV